MSTVDDDPLRPYLQRRDGIDPDAMLYLAVSVAGQERGAVSSHTLTARQQAAWPEAIARLIECGAEGIARDIGSWTVHWHEESRPGQGHAINATYIDGEIFAQVLMDVYGYPIVSFAELLWRHADSDEECPCERCQRESAEVAG